MPTSRDQLERIYQRLLACYGRQGWWPTTPPGGGRPEYQPGRCACRLTPRERWEIAAGAVLTQNTAWRNVEQALGNLALRGLVSPAAVHGVNRDHLAELLRPSGYYNQKARRLQLLAAHVVEKHGGRIARLLSRPATALRDELLSLWGIGPETADSILLYGAGHPAFVIDAYTRRIFGRLGLIDPDLRYHEIQAIFAANLPADATVFGEYHALLVKHATSRCRPAPRCAGCCLRDTCAYPSSE